MVLLVQPETGDDIQWEKAGLLEVADVVVVHKADLPGAAAVEGQVRQTLALSGGRQPPVLRVSSHNGEGIEALWQVLQELPRHRAVDESSGRDLLRLAQEVLAERFAQAEAARDPAVSARSASPAGKADQSTRSGRATHYWGCSGRPRSRKRLACWLTEARGKAACGCGGGPGHSCGTAAPRRRGCRRPATSHRRNP